MPSCLKTFCLVAISVVLVPMAFSQTLPEALRQAYANNPQLDAQRALAQIAGEQVKQAQAGRRPTAEINSSFTVQRNDTNRFDLPAPDPATPDGADVPPAEAIFNTGIQNVGSGQFQVQQQVYAGGRIGGSIRQAEAGRSAARADLEAVLQDVFLQGVAAFVNVQRDRRAIEIRQSSLDLLTEQLQAAQDRFDVGTVTRTDVALAEAQAEGARAELALAQAQLQASIANYEFIVGEQPGPLAAVPPAPAAPETIEEAFEIARGQNPEFLAAIHNVRAAGEGIGLAKADLRPQVSVVGTAGIVETFNDDFRDTNLSAAVQARIPLYQGGLLRSRVRAARLQKNQAEFQKKAIERQVIVDVSNSWYNYIAAQEAIVASQKQVEAARIAYDGGQQELALGVRTTLDVLDQEQALLEAQLAVVDAERDAYIAVHSLLRAMGLLTPDVFGLTIIDTY